MTTRFIYLANTIIIALLLCFGLYLQFYDGIMPCPLCVLQRICFLFLGVVYGAGIFVYRKQLANLIVSRLSACVALLGMFLAGRQVWLQHYPPANPDECGVSLQYMMEMLPMHEVLQKVIAGTAECATRGWDFLSLNMAEWALLWFALFFLVSVRLIRRA
ncbi:MAG TPA: disulfide bond formation protein B [Gammaproteobacteria bacterium]|jgi:disulfide bond formation protein DsbB|nr:disulfide bond formation protein B [Gammaproteobacteria bacterium]